MNKKIAFALACCLSSCSLSMHDSVKFTPPQPNAEQQILINNYLESLKNQDRVALTNLFDLGSRNCTRGGAMFLNDEMNKALEPIPTNARFSTEFFPQGGDTSLEEMASYTNHPIARLRVEFDIPGKSYTARWMNLVLENEAWKFTSPCLTEKGLAELKAGEAAQIQAAALHAADIKAKEAAAKAKGQKKTKQSNDKKKTNKSTKHSKPKIDKNAAKG